VQLRFKDEADAIDASTVGIGFEDSQIPEEFDIDKLGSNAADYETKIPAEKKKKLLSLDEPVDDPTKSMGMRSRTPKSVIAMSTPKSNGAATPKSNGDGSYRFPCSIPPGPKRYCENLETPQRGRCLHGRGEKGIWVLVPLCRIILTFVVAVGSLGVIAYAYFRGQSLMRDKYYYIGFGLYGAVLLAHILIQAFFAALEHRRINKLG
jgi:hypothetical protein